MARALSNYKKLKDVIWYSEHLDTPIDDDINDSTGDTSEVRTSVATSQSVDVETTFSSDSAIPPETHVLRAIDLDFLEKLDKIWIYEATDKSKVAYHRGTKDCFLLETGNGLRLFNVRIDRKGRTGIGSNRQREFTLHFVNKLNNTLFTVHRPYKGLAAMLSWTNLRKVGWKVEVHDGANNLIGTVRQLSSPLFKSFEARDSSGTKCLYVKGPLMENKMLSVKKSRAIYKIYSCQDKRIRVKLAKIEKIYYPLWKVVMGKCYRTLITFNKPQTTTILGDNKKANNLANGSNNNKGDNSTTDCETDHDYFRNRQATWNQKCLAIATAFLIESMLYDYSTE